jgi:hypothetical protein
VSRAETRVTWRRSDLTGGGRGSRIQGRPVSPGDFRESGENDVVSPLNFSWTVAPWITVMTPAQLVPALVIPFVAWRIYLRVRRNIGRQPFQPKRMTVRIIFFSVISLLFGVAAFPHWPALAGLGGGLVAGVPLALFGLHLTRFETTAEGRFYTPNTHIGLALTLLFTGRVVYRLIVLFGAQSSGDLPPPQLFQSPITLVIFGITAGYYIAYYAGVLIRGGK